MVNANSHVRMCFADRLIMYIPRQMATKSDCVNMEVDEGIRETWKRIVTTLKSLKNIIN